MRKLLVTGAAGFIGTNFIHYWLKANPKDRIVGFDALTYAGNYKNISEYIGRSNFRFVHGNINETQTIEDLLRVENVDTVIHFAAESHVDRSIINPDTFIETNVMGTHSLLKACRKVWISEQLVPDTHRFHHISTDEVFGSLRSDEAAFTEITPYAPNSPYASSKAASDFFVRAYHHTYGLNVTTSNCSNNYGPYQFPEKLIPLIILNTLFGKHLPVYGDGKNIRDWLYVTDHVAGIELVLEHGTAGESYNIGGGNEWTNIDIVHLIGNLIDEKFENSPSLKIRFPLCPPSVGKQSQTLITFVEDRAGHDFRYAIDTSNINDKLGFKPKMSIKTGIKETIDWYLSEEKWWKSILDGSYKDRINI